MKNRESKKKLFVVSLAIHVILLVVFPLLLANFKTKQDPEAIEISFYRVDERPKPPEAVVVEPPAVEPAPPKPPRRPEPQPEPAPVPETVPRVAHREPAPDPVPSPKPKPQQPVRTNVFAQAPPEPAVQEAPRKTRRASARVGGFEVTPEPAEASPTPDPHRRVVTNTNFGDEIEIAEARDLRTRDRQSVQSTGFTIEAIADDAPARNAGTGSVSTGGFGDTVAVNNAPRERLLPATNPDTPVEILVKPRPVYTPEARAMQVEGEIVLRVVFVASGQLRVIGVVQGLGYGLDEAAVEAAKQIEFKPARRDGQPVDYAAVLRIVFQLA